MLKKALMVGFEDELAKKAMQKEISDYKGISTFFGICAGVLLITSVALGFWTDSLKREIKYSGWDKEQAESQIKNLKDSLASQGERADRYFNDYMKCLDTD